MVMAAAVVKLLMTGYGMKSTRKPETQTNHLISTQCLALHGYFWVRNYNFTILDIHTQRKCLEKFFKDFCCPICFQKMDWGCEKKAAFQNRSILHLKELLF